MRFDCMDFKVSIVKKKDHIKLYLKKSMNQ